MKRYRIYGCPKCGTIQTIESKIRLKCTTCGRSTNLKNSKGDMVLKEYGGYDNPSVAAEVCKRIKLTLESDGKVKYKGDIDV